MLLMAKRKTNVRIEFRRRFNLQFKTRCGSNDDTSRFPKFANKFHEF